MHPDLERLIQLQQAESELRRLEAELAEIPRRQADLDARLAQERTRLDAAKEASTSSQKARKQHEGRLQDLEAKRSKYKGQLMEVKTNKEYTAMLHEIEAVEREIRGIEDEILVEMEKAEGFVGSIKQEEAAFKGAQEDHKRESAVLLQDRTRLEAKVEGVKKERDAAAATLSTEALELFQRIARRRGTAVAEVKDSTCQQCHLKLRLQMFVEIKRNDQIQQCPACNRILYYEPPPPTVSPEP